jgi:hypothetical protein
MKATLQVCCMLLLIVLSACSGSDTYRGDWKAKDISGNKWDMHFDAKTFTLKNDQGLKEQYNYSQVSVKFENSIRSYGIKLKDGRAFRITFPIPGNTDKGIIHHETTSEAVYSIGRNEYVDFAELIKL